MLSCILEALDGFLETCFKKYYIEEDKIFHEIVKLKFFKDLGVIFDSKLNFGEHIKEKNQ